MNIWNSPYTYRQTPPEYNSTILEQYKICLDMADKVSARRGIANAFFISINTSFASLISLVIKQKLTDYTAIFTLFAILIIGLTLSYTWYRILKSYKQLNTAKFKVIAELEKYLPCRAMVDGEWEALGKGLDRKLYHPLSDLEKYVPVAFGLIYICFFLVYLMHYIDKF